MDIEQLMNDLFSDGYREVLSACSVREPGDEGYEAAERKIPESLVRCIWFDRMFAEDGLETVDGTPVTIASPGRWNVEAGPDFRDAEISFAPLTSTRGDIEVHVRASHWRRHGHHEDPGYDNVVLHVALFVDTPDKHVKTSAGKKVPQFELKDIIQGEPLELLDSIDIGAYPGAAKNITKRCRELLTRRKNADTWLGRFLDLAGDERVIARSRRLEESLAGRTLDRALYEGMMEALGYKANKEQFKELARNVGLDDIRRLVPPDVPEEDGALTIQALLFGMAGLLPADLPESTDPETEEYVDTLRTLWGQMKSNLKQKPMEADAWSFSGVRPTNFPVRRIAGASYILASHLETGLVRALLGAIESTAGKKSRVGFRALEKLFTQPGRGYWAQHCTFGGKPMPRPMSLVGKERATAIVLNIVLPLLLLHARREEDIALERKLHAMYASHGKMAGNSVTRFMRGVLFRDEDHAVEIIKTARRQQGLYQLFRDCCDNAEATCRTCFFARAIAE
ncbi:MAG: DUF2851 family protein [Planctomycetes bacterium]|nr:DUF2851 family protein [Planctomycetota bacterium]